jgi:Mrp family chromosome partitioning ATPase
MFSVKYQPVYRTTACVAARYESELPSANNDMAPDTNEAMKYAGFSAQTLKTLISRSEIRNAAAKEVGESYLRGTISSEVLKESNLLAITVDAGTPGDALKTAQAILLYMKNSEDKLLGGIKVTVVQEPRLAEQPVNSRSNVKLAVAAGIAVFFAICALLAWRSSAKRTIRNSTEAASVLGTELLAEIPHEKTRGKNLLITDPSVSAGYAEEVRSLAIRLMNTMEREGEKVLFISGAIDGEGKSTAAANIALALSQMNRKVILADLDFRNPSLAKILNMQVDEAADLTQFLESGDAAGMSGLIRRVPGTELSAVLNSKVSPMAVDRYSGQIEKCLELLRDKADFVIVDSASVSAGSDAEELACMVDASVIVVREHFADAAAVTKAAAVLAGNGPLLGCVFNNARANAVSADAGKRGKGGQYGR